MRLLTRRGPTAEELRVAAAMRAEFPRLETRQSFELARVAVRALGLEDMDAAVTRAAIGFAEKEAETMGWDATEYRHKYGSYEELIGERMGVWRNEVEAGVFALIEEGSCVRRT